MVLDGTCTQDPNMNLIIQYGLLGLVLGLGLGLGFILYWRMARIHQNGRRARAGKVGQLPHIILWRNRFVRRKMPSHANCVVPGCPNRKDHCKWDLFPSKKMFRDVRRTSSGGYVDRR